MHGNKGHWEPSTKSERNETTDCTNGKNVPKTLGNIHCLLQHYHTEWDSRNPADETYDGENTEKGENYSRWPVVLAEVVDGSPNTEDNLEYARDPDELLGERTSHGEVEPWEGKGDSEDKCE